MVHPCVMPETTSPPTEAPSSPPGGTRHNPKRRSPAIPRITNKTPSSSDGYASGPVESSFPLESEMRIPKCVRDLALTLICSGLSTPVFFSKATTDTTKSNQFHRLPIKVKNIVAGLPYHRGMSTNRVGWSGTEVVCACVASSHGSVGVFWRS